MRPLRIGVLARTLSQRYGVGVYAENFLRALAGLGSEHEVVVFLRAPAGGRLPEGGKLRPVVVGAPSKALWDQAAAPRAARRERVDFLFNTKFTLPLVAPCPTGMCLHGSMYFVHPELCGSRLDTLYLRAFMPRYLAAASLLVANSELTARDHLRAYPRETAGKIRVLPLAAAEEFAPVEDTAVLQEARRRYALPPRFWLTVSRRDPRKNLPALFAALARLPRPRLPLVAVGEGSETYARECDFEGLGIAGEVVFPGYVPQADLPALYTLAEGLVFPSIYEEFGIPLVEAMRCGCPVIAAGTGALPEVAGEAALLVDPRSPAELAAAMARLEGDPELRATLARRGLERARRFSWWEHARGFVAAVEEVCARSAERVVRRESVEHRGRGWAPARSPRHD
ncbi:MAG: glycosyltransferase family 4 protein [Gemmatimonadota bacterium]